MHIALVESSASIQAGISDLLTPRGHKVASFANPCEALESIKSERSIEAVIASADLSPITGVEFCWEIRLLSTDERPIYLLLMSSDFSDISISEAFDVGADDLISRPPSKEELFARIRSGERALLAQRRIFQLATSDPLTGIGNRRAFFQRATEICRDASETGRIAAILLDIDNFKSLNDVYGHQAGDIALCLVACEAKRDQSLVGRLGGDEICILLEDCDLSNAREVAEELRCRIAALQINTAAGKARLTCSLGVSELKPEDDVNRLIWRAELALYRAKLEGRDCVSLPPSSPSTLPNYQTSRIARRRARVG